MPSYSPIASETRSSESSGSLSTLMLVIGLGMVIIGGMLLTGGVGILTSARHVFFLGSALIGVVLYYRYPVQYVSYSLWMWFLASFIRRMIDYYAGWQDPNIVTLTPYIVSGLGFLTIIKHYRRLLDKDYFPIALIMAAIVYGYGVGLVKTGPMAATFEFIKWIVPISFGLHISLVWNLYPQLRQSIKRTFLWGVGLMGIYGILQFFLMPPWDAYWMIESNMRAIGQPYPLKVRVFATMQIYVMYANAMMTGLLLLFQEKTWKHVMAAIPGYGGFLLSLVRQSWGAWVLSMMMMVLWIKGPKKTQLIFTLFAGIFVLIPLLAVPQIANQVTARMGTFGGLSEDKSMTVRIGLYRNLTATALSDPIGRGLGTAGISQGMKTESAGEVDSGFLMFAFQLGWPGLFLCMMGLFLLVKLLLRIRKVSSDPLAITATAIALTNVVLMLFSNQLIGASSTLFFTMVGVTLANYRYERYLKAASYDAEWEYDEDAPIPNDDTYE